MVDHTVVKIFTAQMSVSGGRFDLENSILNGQNWHIEGSATQIENEDVRFLTGALFLVQTVGDGSSGRF